MLTFNRTSIGQRSSLASADDIREVFRENDAELQWIGYFITGDSEAAAACVANACNLSESRNGVFPEWLLTWARYATIRCAIDSERERVKKASSNYCQPRFIRQVHEPLSGEALEFVITESDTLIGRLDVVCRITLVICGVYGKSVADAALMLGISVGGAQAACSAAMNVVEAARHQHAMRDNLSPLLWNRA